MLAEIGAFREVLAQQAVGVFVRCALPWAVWVAEEDGNAGVDSQLCVLGHLRTLVPSQRTAELVGQRDHRSADRLSDSLCTVAGESWSIFYPQLIAVAGHPRKMQQ